MSIWYSRYFGSESYEKTQDFFTQHLIRMGAPREMTLLSSGSAAETTVHLRLTDEKMAGLYPGFVKSSLKDIPADFQFLGGHDGVRAELKEELARK